MKVHGNQVIPPKVIPKEGNYFENSRKPFCNWPPMEHCHQVSNVSLSFKKRIFQFGEFSTFDPPVPPHSPKGVINGFREKCPIWMFLIIRFSVLWKKEFFNSANMQILNPPNFPQNNFFENSSKPFLRWPLWSIVTKFQSSRSKTVPWSDGTRKKTSKKMFKHRECFHFYCQNSGAIRKQ